MRKLIAGGLIIFGAMSVTAQVTPPQDTTRTKTEKKMNKTTPETVQPNGMNGTIDTTTIQDKSKKTEDKNRKRLEPRKDGLNNEAVKPTQPAPGQLE
ncbi:hypothetical protein [Epilithonimonas caeni]|uniref:hypothetical protein n=1 Tax=Epilithonimonas caeni TaxID=365343 RepID=UPI0003F60FE0|nr:hypothetical protein [Epilithonimonas caeni]